MTPKTLFQVFFAFASVVFTAVTASAADRAQLVHSRLNSTLAGFLPSTDFVVVVKKVDESPIDTMPGSSGAVRSLPGLNLSVDSQGRVVKSQEASAYSGPLDVTVVLDRGVRKDTVETLKKMLPELAGTTLDEDSFRVQQASLRQAATSPDAPPSVVIQNMPPSGSPESSSSDMPKLIAFLLVGMGALMWLFGRRAGGENTPHPHPEKRPEPKGSEPVTPKSPAPLLEGFGAEVVGLYLMGALKAGDRARALAPLRAASLDLQRDVLLSLPPWLGSWMLDKLPSKDDGEEEATPLERVLRELTLLKAEVDAQPERAAELFLERLPLEALEAARSSGYRIETRTLRNLASFRDDAMSLLSAQDLASEPPAAGTVAASTCATELRSLKKLASRASNSASQDPVEVWASSLNRLKTFEEVAAGLESALTKLDESARARLQRRVPSVDSFATLEADKIRALLHEVDPEDWAWMRASIPSVRSWDLAAYTRPRRQAVLSQTEKRLAEADWSGEVGREASARCLALLRSLGQETPRRLREAA
jgi:hypothetical protein